MEQINCFLKNEYIKLDNPITDGLGNPRGCYTYHGIAEDYNFDNQKKNFDKFKEIIGSYNIYPDNIYAAKFTVFNEKRQQFILTTSNHGLIFYHYHGPSTTSNIIYFKKQKIKLGALDKMEPTLRNKYFELLHDDTRTKL